MTKLTEQTTVKLTLKQRYHLAAETGLDPRTITRAYQGRLTKLVTRGELAAAARKLSLPTPPEASK